MSCSKEGIGELAILKSGDYFGEIAIVGKKGAQATVEASTSIVVLQMSKVNITQNSENLVFSTHAPSWVV